MEIPHRQGKKGRKKGPDMEERHLENPNKAVIPSATT